MDVKTSLNAIFGVKDKDLAHMAIFRYKDETQLHLEHARKMKLD